MYILFLLDISPVWHCQDQARSYKQLSHPPTYCFMFYKKKLMKKVMYFSHSCYHTFKSGSFINAVSLQLIGLQDQHICFVDNREIVQKWSSTQQLGMCIWNFTKICEVVLKSLRKYRHMCHCHDNIDFFPYDDSRINLLHTEM